MEKLHSKYQESGLNFTEIQKRFLCRTLPQAPSFAESIGFVAPQSWPDHPRLLGKLLQEIHALAAYHDQTGNMFAEGIVDGFSDQLLVSKNGIVW